MATITKIVGKRKTSFKVRIRKSGGPNITKSFSNKSLAEKWAKKTEFELEEGVYFEKQEASKHTLTELIDRYLDEELEKLAPTDWHARRLQLKWWKNQLGSKTLNQIKLPDLVQCINKLKNEKNAKGKFRTGSTINRYVAALSVVFSIGVSEWHWLTDNPFKGYRRQKENRSRTRFLTAEERVALLESCKQSKTKTLYLITLLSLATGMRQAEIMTLKWDQVSWERNSITLNKTKNGSTRVVPLLSLAHKELKNYGKVRNLKNTHVFPGRKNNTHTFFPRKAWDAAVKRSGIKDFRYHDLRHSAASEMAMSGASLFEISIILGHKNMEMTKRYSHLTESHSADIVRKMNEAIFGI